MQLDEITTKYDKFYEKQWERKSIVLVEEIE